MGVPAPSRLMSAVNPLRLAVLLPVTEVGGHERMLLEWLKEAAKSGLHPIVLCARGTEVEAVAEGLGFECRDVDYVHRTNDSLRRNQWRHFLTTFRIVARLPSNVTIMLAPGAMQASLSHLFACALLGRRIACYVPMAHDSRTLRASRPVMRDRVARSLATRVAIWITITEQQRHLLRQYWNIRAPIHIVPNRLECLSRNTALPIREAPAGQILRIAFIGRFDASQKGLDWLVRFITSRADPISTQYVFQGRGEFHTHLQVLAQQMPPGMIELRPWGSVAEGMRDADLLLLTSRFEGFPLIAIEAIHAGLPVVTTRQSGLTDILPAEAIVEFGDDAALAEAIQAMRDPAHRVRAVQHARAQLDSLLSAGKYAEAVRNVVEVLLNQDTEPK
jgi:glycosyltransferase involved in cell wall biosynthesis